MITIHPALNNAGDLDPTFNDGQARVFNFGLDENCEGRAVAVGRDGRIYVVGDSLVGVSKFGILSLEADGSVNKDFNGGCPIIGDFGDLHATGDHVLMVVDADSVEKLLILGMSSDYSNGYEVLYPAMARFNLNGSLDKSFGVEGYCVIRPDFEEGRGFLFREPNWHVTASRIYVVGGRVVGGSATTVVMCTHINGQVDYSFGNNGFVIVINDAGPGGTQLECIHCTANGIYLAGNMVSGRPYSTFARLSLNGQLDTTFGNEGFVVDLSRSASIIGLDQHQNGSLIGFGYWRRQSDEGGLPYVSMIRVINHEGSLDPNFNDGKLLLTEIGLASEWRNGFVQADGRIVAMGWMSKTLLPDDLDIHTTIARFMPDGSLDKSFGREGTGWVNYGDRERGSKTAFAVQNDCAIVVVGNIGPFNDRRLFVTRFKG